MIGQNLIYIKESNNFIDKECEILNKVEYIEHEEKLVYPNEILNDDDKYLMEYCLCDEPVIKIADEFRAGMQIFIKTIDNKIFTLEMEHSNKIRDVKMKIEEKTKLSADQQNLFCQGEILDDDNKTVDQYRICENSMIDIVAGLRGGMRGINVETYEGNKYSFPIFSLFVDIEDIEDIKLEIQKKTGLHPDDQILIDQDKFSYESYFRSINRSILEMYYPYGREKKIFVATKPKVMQIFARQIDGEKFSLLVEKSDKIIDIKLKIQEKIGLHPDEQILIDQGEILNYFEKLIDGIKLSGGILDDDNKSIADYPIFDRHVINIVYKSKNEIQILIKISNKSIIPINIVKNSRIIDLKSKITEETGMQFDGNNLIYDNKILDNNDKLLIDYHIDDGCVISIDGDSRLTLFIQAIKNGSLKTVQDLYDSKFHEMMNQPCSSNPLHYACKLNNADIVRFLIEKKFGINSYDRKLKKPIHYASINNCVEILKTLIKNKCCLKANDSNGMKPIHLACLHGNYVNVKLLIENGCDLECRDYLERRPIHLACLAGNIDIVKLLIQKKCEIDVLDKSNKSPIDIAENENFTDIMELINEEISKRGIENMIKELDLKCLKKCDHKFCPSSLLGKTFDKGVQIRQGGTGKVYKCKLSQSALQIAIKEIWKDKIHSKYIEGNINQFIDKINHKRIIKYFGTITKEENVFIFMEFMSRGSLRSLISTNPPIISSKVIHFTMQILEGLQFLHNNKIIHRDIKPDNILLDNDGNVKLTDLGLGLSLYTTDGHTQQANTFCGTPYYTAPEICNEEPYSYGADIWSLGATVIEMVTGMRPYHGLPHAKVIFQIMTTKTIPYELPVTSPRKMKEFIDQMLIPEPSKRLSAADLINNLKNI